MSIYQPISESEKLSRRKIEALSQEVQFRPRLYKLLAENPNASTVQGLANLAHTVQADIFATSGLTRGDLGKDVSNANTEFASRVAPTMLDRTRVDLGYEKGNLDAWLVRKGLEVQLTGEREIHWSQGVGKYSGSHERDYYFKTAEMGTGADIAALELLSAQLTEMAALHQGRETDVKVLNFTAAMSSAVAAELRTLAQTGKPLDEAEVRILLQEPLSSIGLRLTQRPPSN